jgi:6-phosphogluconolactonase (cycloisomerase 2 family)
MLTRTSSAPLAAVWALAASVAAQATYVNFETPQVKPIALATVGGTEFLLACNTPDDSVEIYDPNTASPATAPVFVARVPVGQGPASVRFDPETACFYTANYVGDSVTKVQLANPAGTLQWSLIATKPVGESPADLALSADGTTLFVTLADASRLATLDSTTLDPTVAPATLTTTTVAGTFGVKEPRRIEVHNGARWILNMKGGNLHSPWLPTGTPGGNSATYDLDLWTFDPTTSTTRVGSGLGTTNAGMAFGADGRLYVVGSMARNEVLDEPNLQALAVTGTGFVESWLWVVDPTSATLSVLSARDLNRNTAGGVIAKPRTCSQPMDVALLQTASTVDKVYIATFASDRLVVLTTNAGPATGWARTLVNVPITPTPGSYGRNGPRGLAFNAAQTRLYCMNLLSNSVSVIDVTTDLEAVRFPLQWDMTPSIVREGRRFLYSAEFSGNEMVSCSSCHVDARSDSLGWDIGTPAAGAVQHPVGLDDVIRNPDDPPDFAADKGIMITQSLQGLVNHPLNTAGQDLFSNKPYHWRGDRADFLAFNGAFVGLMGLPDLDPGTPVIGITTAQMTTYRDAIATVMYTPNPEQAPERVLRGTFGNAGDTTTGTDAMRGLKVFHIDPQFRCQGRSCVQCHALPEGSNNRITTAPAGGLETAAMRSLFQREGRAEANVIANTVGQSNVMTSHFGLTHDGHTHGPGMTNPFFGIVVDGAASIDRFVFDSFGGFPTPADYARFEDLVKFCREFDAGIAPAIGVAWTVTFANQALAATTAAFNLLEQQVRVANTGLAVHARIGGTVRAYWFDVTVAAPGYREHGTATVLTRAALLASLGAADVLVLQGTPAGSERRVASLNGQPGLLTGAAPTNVALQPLRPATHWAVVPQLTKNWDPFDLSANGFAFSNPLGLTPQSLKSVRLLQRGLIQFAPALGLTALRHEAPRRFAVSGDDIRVGATLQLRVPAPSVPGTPPPYANLATDTVLVELGLYPTDQFVAEKRVWETTAEADPLVAYTLLLGGAGAPGVAAAVNTPHLVTETTSFPAGTFDPLVWNLFHVTVVNEDTTASVGAWQQLTIQ